MRIRWANLLLTASLLAPGAAVFGDDTAADAIKNPQVTYDKHEVRSDADKQAIYQQKMEETKASLDQAKKDLDQARAQNDAKVIKAAQKRVKDLQKEYDQLAQKHNNMTKELNEDRQDLNEAQREQKQY